MPVSNNAFTNVWMDKVRAAKAAADAAEANGTPLDANLVLMIDAQMALIESLVPFMEMQPDPQAVSTPQSQ